ncbi:MAG: thiamine phosphate synthase [Phascolarctobacterium sp.]
MFEEGKGTSCLHDYYEQKQPRQLDRFQLIAVTDAASCPRSLAEQIERIANFEHKPTRLILRAKGLATDVYAELARQTQPLCLKYNIEFIIHTHWQLAQSMGLIAVHMPLPLLADIPLEVRNSLCISTSVHSVAEAEQALQLGAKALISGHIYATSCKPGLPPRGLEFLRSIHNVVVKHTTPTNSHPFANHSTPKNAPSITSTHLSKETLVENSIPIYAIGGIGFDASQWRELQSAGAAGACIMSGYMQI